MTAYNVHGGHSLKCRGASGLLDEVNEDRKVKNRVIELLRARGATVYDCTDDTSTTKNSNLRTIVTKCNGHKVDLDVSIHLNEGGGHGVETLGYSDKVKDIGSRISSNISKALGITDRGFKISTKLYVLRKTNSPAILIECCFVDSNEDHDKWNVDKCANAIVDALMNTTTTNVSKPVAQPTQPQHRFNLIVDGKVGHGTVKALQSFLNVGFSDGVLSGQLASTRKYHLAFVNGSIVYGTGGSATVKALQRWVGVKADGYMGADTIKALQRKIGAKADGYFGAETAKALQTYLNNLKI